MQRYNIFAIYASIYAKNIYKFVFVGVDGFSRRYAPNNPYTLLGGVLHKHTQQNASRCSPFIVCSCHFLL